MVFNIALTNVLLTLLYIIPGVLVCKFKKAMPEHLPGISGIMIYIGTPFLILSAFMSLDYSPSLALKMGLFFLISFCLQLAFMLIVSLIFRKDKDAVRKKFVTVGTSLGNVGFFGLPLITALMPDVPEAAAYVTMFMASMNVITFTFGIYKLTGDKKYISLKGALLNPTFLGLALALPVFFFRLRGYIPGVLQDEISLLGKMATPMCMFILGIRLCSIKSFKTIFKPLTFLICAGKLIVFPLFCYAVVSLLPIDKNMVSVAVLLAGMPCAAIVQSLSEIHGTSPEIPAGSILLSTLTSFLTLPIIAAIVLN